MNGRTVWAARVVVFVAFLDLFIQFPVVAPYVRSLEATATFVGVVVGAYSATNLIGNAGAGLALDRWGRKTPVLIGLVITAASLLAYAAAANATALLAARALHGLAAGVLTPGAFAMIGDVSPASERGRAMGVSGATIAVAAVMGPPLAGIISDVVGFEAVFILAAALMLLTAGVFAATARETARSIIPADDRPDVGGTVSRYRGLMTNAQLAAACTAVLGLTVSLGTLVTYLPLALEEQGESAARSGTAFTAYAIVALAVMVSPVNRLSDRRGRLGGLMAGLGVMVVGLGVLFALPGINGATLGMAVFGLGFGLLFPAATALVADATGIAERGAAFGIFYAVYSLGVVIGSVLSGAFADLAGGPEGAPFLASAAVIMATMPATALLWRWRHVEAMAPRSAGATGG